MKTLLNKSLNIYLNIYKRNKKNKFLNFVLKFFSYLFFVLYKTRLILYKLKILKTYTLPVYVVSIGNITSGGTGKTPICIEVGKYFMSMKRKVAILTRGYNTKNEDKVTLVSDGSEILVEPEDCGDEAFLIAKNLPKAIVFAGKNRIKAAKTAINLGAEVVIIDDGFQYLKLNRNENILMIDSYSPFDNRHLLPFGKLRELPDSINRASAIIISNSQSKNITETDLSTIKKHANKIPITKTSYRIKELTSLNTKRILKASEVKNLRTIACCGIGNPESFIDLLKRNEIIIVENLIYPDHHKYTYADIENMIKLCKSLDTETIIITGKDAVKITDLCQAAPVNFWAVKIDILWDESGFLDKLFQKSNQDNKP